MAEFHRVAAISEIPPGTGKELTVAGRVIALYNVEGVLHALDGVCPHAGGPLGQGELSGSIVTCPWHGWQFDVTNGRHCLNANIQHDCFAVKVDAGQISVEIP